MQVPLSTAIFVDSNVWYSRTLRDWIALLYTHSGTPSLFQVHWTVDVMAELLYHLRRNHPDWDGGRITQIHDALTKTFEVGRVEDFPGDSAFAGADRHDAHVHSAAVACRAAYLVTLNTKDFQRDPDDLPYEVLTPDEFFMLVAVSAPGLVDAAAMESSHYWVKRQGEANLPKRLKNAECPQFAEHVRRALLEQQRRSRA